MYRYTITRPHPDPRRDDTVAVSVIIENIGDPSDGDEWFRLTAECSAGTLRQVAGFDATGRLVVSGTGHFMYDIDEWAESAAHTLVSRNGYALSR